MTLRSKDVNAGGSERPQSLNRDQHNVQFYEQYRKIFSTGYCLSQQLRQLVETKETLWKKLIAYEKKAQEDFRDKIRREAPEKKKRNRRTADEIQKKWTCQAPRCQRHYGSEGSLIQHLKLKHPEMYEQLPKKKQEDQEHHQDQSYLSE